VGPWRRTTELGSCRVAGCKTGVITLAFTRPCTHRSPPTRSERWSTRRWFGLRRDNRFEICDRDDATERRPRLKGFGSRWRVDIKDRHRYLEGGRRRHLTTISQFVIGAWSKVAPATGVAARPRSQRRDSPVRPWHANAAAAQLFPIENTATETWLTRASFTVSAAGNASAAPVAKPPRILQSVLKRIGSAVKLMKTEQFFL